MDFGDAKYLKLWLTSRLANIVNAEEVSPQMHQLIISNASSHIAILITLIATQFGEILGDAKDAFIVDLFEFLSKNTPSTSSTAKETSTAITTSKRAQTPKYKVKKPKCEKTHRDYNQAELDNWREIAQNLIADYDNSSNVVYNEPTEAPRPPKDEHDAKIFFPTMMDLQNFELYYDKVLLPWSQYYGGIVLRMPKEWLDYLPKKSVMSDPSLILKTQIQIFNRFNENITSLYNRPLDTLHSMSEYHDIIMTYSNRNAIRENNNYEDNIAEVMEMLERGDSLETPYASDIEIEYLMKNIEGTFNFGNFPNILRAYANYDDQELPGITKVMGYAGSIGSMSSTHFEDFNANALNLLIFGAEKVWKCWRGDLQDGIIALGEKLLKQLKKGRRKNTIVKSSCTKPFQDKAFVLSSKVVRENDLPFTLIVQKPGDMVITFPRAYHQVTNAGFNFAVAVNFGYTSFLKDALLYEGCCCNGLNEVLPQIVVALKNGAQQLPNREIEILCAYCNIVLADVHALECHNKSIHFTKTAYTCKYCTTYIAHKCSLRSHLEICDNAKAAKYDPVKAESYFTVVPKNNKGLKPHPKTKKQKRRAFQCTIIIDKCSRFFETKAKLNDHIRKCHSSALVDCFHPKCNEQFSRKDNMYRHVRKKHIDYIHLIPNSK